MSDDSKLEVFNRVKVESTDSQESSKATTEEERTAIREQTRDTLEKLAKDLVDFPQDVSVTFFNGDRTTVYKIECSQRVLGQILGSKGKTINGLRAVISAITARQGLRTIIEVPYFQQK